MRSALARRSVSLALAAAAGGAGMTGTALADAPSGTWTSTQVTGLTSPVLYAVTAPDRAHAWAVGTRSSSSAPLILRYRHGAWKQQAAPAGAPPVLADVDARGPSDVWTVGPGSGDAPGASLHWNGRRWKAVPYPAAKPLAVSVDSAGRAWSAGYTADGSGVPTAAVYRYEHGAWVSKKPPAVEGELTTLVARTPKDVWAGGATSSGTGLFHYDGRKWTQMSIPGDWPYWILQVVPVARDDAWFYAMPKDPLFRGPDLVHWDGSTFTVTPTPSPGDVPGSAVTPKSAGSVLGAIAPDGRGGIWLQDGRTAYYRHYDGTTWTSVPRPPNDLGGWPVVNSLARIGRTASLWGVGRGAGDVLLIDRFR